MRLVAPGREPGQDARRKPGDDRERCKQQASKEQSANPNMNVKLQKKVENNRRASSRYWDLLTRGLCFLVGDVIAGEVEGLSAGFRLLLRDKTHQWLRASGHRQLSVQEVDRMHNSAGRSYAGCQP